MFTAADSGLHRICFTPSGPAAVTVGGWFSSPGRGVVGGVRLYLDLAIGASSAIGSDDKDKIDSIVGRVKDLNARLQDIRREQVFQRVGLQCRSPNSRCKLTSWLTGSRGWVQRPEWGHERQNRPLDTDPIGGIGGNLCLAIVSFTILLHQTKAHLSGQGAIEHTLQMRSHFRCLVPWS